MYVFRMEEHGFREACGHSARFPQGKGWFRAAMWPKWAFSARKNMVLRQPCGHSVRFLKEKHGFRAAM